MATELAAKCLKSTLSVFISLGMLEKILGNLRNARAKSGFSQAYIAEKLNVEQVTYGRWERGDTAISVRDLLRICTVFSIDITDLFPSKASRKAKHPIQITMVLNEKEEPDVELLLYLHNALKNYSTNASK